VFDGYNFVIGKISSGMMKVTEIYKDARSKYKHFDDTRG